MRDGRINGFAADRCEVLAADQFGLERVDEVMCDAYATADTPSMAEGTPVEVKSTQVWIGNGAGHPRRGRFTIHAESHEELREADGWYALVVYEKLEVAGGTVVVPHRIAIMPARTVQAITNFDVDTKPKLPWGTVFDEESITAHHNTAAWGMDRLFVPLNSEPYHYFDVRMKEWEARAVKGQYNRDQVRVGREVELRKGYSTDESLWGVIDERRFYDSIPEMVGDVGHDKILPDNSRLDVIKSLEEKYDDEDEFVAFRPVLTVQEGEA